MARRRRRFGSPPARHRREAGRILGVMRREVKRFNTVMKKGQCGAALDVLLGIQALGSAAYREREGEKHGTLLARGAMSPGRSLWGTARLRNQMKARFLKQCAVTRR